MLDKEPEELLVIEPIIGYKFLNTLRCKLESPVEGTFWVKGINIARCAYKYKTCRDIPEFDCDCGFHTYKDIEEINKYFKEIDISTNVFLLAELQLTGKVIEHELGYRSEKAEIKELIFNDSNSVEQLLELKQFKPISNYYEIPLIGYRDYLEIIKIRKCLK